MEEYYTQDQTSRIKSVLDEYVSLGPLSLNVYLALEFIINCYLIAVGFRPLFFSDNRSLNAEFWESVIYQAKTLFPQLTFYRKSPQHIFIHHPLLIVDYNDYGKNLGSLLNFITPLDIGERTGSSINFFCGYKNINNIPLTGYFIHGSTQVNEITNKLFQMQLLLKNLNVRVSVEFNAT
jgi:hypothetical protein